MPDVHHSPTSYQHVLAPALKRQLASTTAFAECWRSASRTDAAAMQPAPHRTQPCRRRHVADTTGGNPTPTTD
jgi:hypothetical protein